MQEVLHWLISLVDFYDGRSELVMCYLHHDRKAVEVSLSSDYCGAQTLLEVFRQGILKEE